MAGTAQRDITACSVADIVKANGVSRITIKDHLKALTKSKHLTVMEQVAALGMLRAKRSLLHCWIIASSQSLKLRVSGCRSQFQ